MGGNFKFQTQDSFYGIIFLGDWASGTTKHSATTEGENCGYGPTLLLGLTVLLQNRAD